MKLHVFVNRRKLDLGADEMTAAELLRAAGFEGEGWDLLRLQGEGDPTGGDTITATEVLHLRNGDRFRVIPGNRTFGARSRVALEVLQRDADGVVNQGGVPVEIAQVVVDPVELASGDVGHRGVVGEGGRQQSATVERRGVVAFAAWRSEAPGRRSHGPDHTEGWRHSPLARQAAGTARVIAGTGRSKYQAVDPARRSVG